MTLDLTVVILTKNESIHITRALNHLKGLASRVLVVDSYSTDDTVAMAKAGGADVLQNKFINYSKQFQWALDHGSIQTNWVMRLDADEIIESDLRENLLHTVPNLPNTVAGINIKRKHIFLDHWVRFGGRYPLVLLRIWRNGQGRIEDRWMDEHMIIWGGNSITLEGGFCDHNLNNLSFFTTKHNAYATREALDVLIKRHKLSPEDDSLSKESGPAQAAIKRLLKERLYNKLPFTLSSLLYFLWRYIFQLGFLDGRTGLIYHFLQGYWYRFLVGAKLLELEREISGIPSPEQKKVRLLELTGHNLDSTA